MPNETGTAFLVDSTGQETLSEREQKAIRQYLDMPNGPACEAVEWLLYCATKDPVLDDKEVLGQSLWHYGNTDDHSLAEGVLASIPVTGEISDLTREETGILQDTLTVIRAGGWFPEWLGNQVRGVAESPDDPTCRFPTPLQIAASLGFFIREHEEQMEGALKIARTRPDLLLPAPPAKPATLDPPAVPETAQPAPKSRANAHGTRKPRKKVAHA